MYLGDHSTGNIIGQRDYLTFTANYLVESKTNHLSL
ncbi:hypothetical protein CMUS01_15685 [Colletotrichum musicola]|uniref:Uncharacterized protein n=1 Tax=Colletotrichum musicola TaxID=2175873 RepID=A0A8H6IV11_9PEZI|nr:hypothetical protein CMUS01_15685 [Colletotrichum musicola]